MSRTERWRIQGYLCFTPWDRSGFTAWDVFHRLYVAGLGLGALILEQGSWVSLFGSTPSLLSNLWRSEGQDFRVDNSIFHSHKWPASDALGLICLCRLSFLQLRLEWVIFKACFSTVSSLWVHKVFPALLLIDQKGTYKYTCEWRWMDYEIGNNNNEPLRQRNSSSWHPRLIFPALFIPAQI